MASQLPYGGVLEQKVHYSNLPPAPQYMSNSSFDPRGMEHVYLLTNTFLDLIQRDRVLPQGMNATTLINAMSRGPENAIAFLEVHWQELLLQHIGVLTAVVFGLLLASLLPIIGFFFCCCRCCGNCGAYPDTPYDKKLDTCRRVFLGLLLSLFVIAALFGCVCSFVTNFYSFKGYSQVPTKLSTSLNDSSRYIDHTGKSFDTLLVKNFEEMEKVVNSVLNQSGPILRQKLNNVSEAIAIEKITTMVSGLSTVKSTLRDITIDTRELEDKVNSLNSGLKKSQSTLSTTLALCEGHSACRRFTNEYKLDEDLEMIESYLGISFTLPNHGLTNAASEISDLLEADLVAQVTSGKLEIDDLEASVTAAVQQVAPEFKQNLRKIGEELKEKNMDIQSVLSNIDIPPLLEEVPKMEDLTLQWVEYRYYTGMVMASIVLLILFCFVLGLFYGFCGRRAGALYGDDCCNKGTGSNFLATGIYLVFLFALPVLLLTTTHFLLGSMAEKAVCETLTQPDSSDIFSELDRQVLTPLIRDQVGEVGKNKPSQTGAKILRDCHQNKTIYMVFGMDQIYNLSSLSKWRTTFGFGKYIQDLQIRHNLDSIVLLSADTKRELQELANAISKISSLSWTQLINLKDDMVTKVDLGKLIRKLRTLKLQVSRQDGMRQVAIQLELDIRGLEQMEIVSERLKLTVRRLKTRLNSVETSLKLGMSSLRTALEELILQTERAETMLRSSGSELISNLTDQLVADTGALFDGYADRLVNGLKKEVGTCSPLSNSFNATVVAVCNEVVLPFNAFWASVGWCYLLYLPCILLSVSLIKLYRKTESYPGPHAEAEVQPLDGQDREKIRRRGHRRTQSSCRLPEFTHSRALPALPPDEDGNAPPRYTSNPSLPLAEYERPPPYYFPNRGK